MAVLASCSKQSGKLNSIPRTGKTEIGLKMLTGIDEQRFAKLLDRSEALRRIDHPHLARHLNASLGPHRPRSRLTKMRMRPILRSTCMGRWRPPKHHAEQSRATREILGWGHEIAAAIGLSPCTTRRRFRTSRRSRTQHHHPRRTTRALLIDYDTILWGDSTDTSIVSLSSLNPTPQQPGLAGAKRADIQALAVTLLRAFAHDANSELGSDELTQRATANLTNHAKDPRGVATNLIRATTSPPQSADDLHRIVQDRFENRPRRQLPGTWVSRTAILAGAALIVGGSIFAATWDPSEESPQGARVSSSPARTTPVVAQPIDYSALDTCDELNPTFGTTNYEPLAMFGDRLNRIDRGEDIQGCSFVGETSLDIMVASAEAMTVNDMQRSVPSCDGKRTAAPDASAWLVLGRSNPGGFSESCVFLQGKKGVLLIEFDDFAARPEAERREVLVKLMQTAFDRATNRSVTSNVLNASSLPALDKPLRDRPLRPPADTSTVIAPGRWGQVEAGMTAERAIDTGQVKAPPNPCTNDRLDPAGTKYKRTGRDDNDDGIPDLFPITELEAAVTLDSRGRVDFIGGFDITKTAAGIADRSTIKDLHSAYKKRLIAVVVDEQPLEQFKIAEGTKVLQFNTQDGRVSGMMAYDVLKSTFMAGSNAKDASSPKSSIQGVGGLC